jgi:hypothetical protein
MLSPVGRTADTRELLWEMLTCACGVRPAVVERAEGFLGRSTIVAVDYEAVERIEVVGRSRRTGDNMYDVVADRGRGIKGVEGGRGGR